MNSADGCHPSLLLPRTKGAAHDGRAAAPVTLATERVTGRAGSDSGGGGTVGTGRKGAEAEETNTGAAADAVNNAENEEEGEEDEEEDDNDGTKRGTAAATGGGTNGGDDERAAASCGGVEGGFTTGERGDADMR